MGLVVRLLAPGIFGADMDDAGQPLAPHPEEEIFVARAAPKRQRDFVLGRACARAALAGLEHGAAAIDRRKRRTALRRHRRSITHTGGYAAALAAEARLFSGIGVDAERVGGVTEDLWPRLFDAAERDHLMGPGEESRAVMATLFFSAGRPPSKAWRMKARWRSGHPYRAGRGWFYRRRRRILRGAMRWKVT